MTGKKPKRVREQAVVYLAGPDRALLEQLAAKTGLSRTELFRRGLRRLADDTLTEKKPGWSLEYLIANAVDDGLPPDVAARHDYYLGGGYEDAARKKRARKPKRARPG